MPIIVESGKEFGVMSSGLVKLENMTPTDIRKLQMDRRLNIGALAHYVLTSEDRRLVLMRHRQKFGRAFGFDGAKMFMANQDSFKGKEGLQHGTHFEVTKDCVEANPDCWSVDIPEDILVIKNDVPGVVIGHSVADCPVVVLTDKKQGISAVAHCGAAMIDAHLPEMLAEVLLRKYGSRAEDVFAYVSACAGDSWVYDGFPKWAKDMKVWDHTIYQGTDGKFHINIKPAVLEQLLKTGIERSKIIVNQDDTITNPSYYSNSAASPKGGNDPTKEGRHYAGLFYPNGDNGDITVRGPRR